MILGQAYMTNTDDFRFSYSYQAVGMVLKIRLHPEIALKLTVGDC